MTTGGSDHGIDGVKESGSHGSTSQLLCHSTFRATHSAVLEFDLQARCTTRLSVDETLRGQGFGIGFGGWLYEGIR
jgi:hypothetical protein